MYVREEHFVYPLIVKLFRSLWDPVVFFVWVFHVELWCTYAHSLL